MKTRQRQPSSWWCPGLCAVGHWLRVGQSSWRLRFLWLLFGLQAILLCVGLLLVASARASEPMLAMVYGEHHEVAGWLMSEKLDGVRGHWDGRKLRSKNGMLLMPPAAFTQGLPPFALEGELWAGRGGFARTVAIVKKQQPHDGWLQLTFAIFDVPQEPGPFTARLARAQAWFADHPSPHAFVIPQIPIKDENHLQQELARVLAQGGEGLMVRRPDAPYVTGRSADILKVKTSEDAEARVVGHLPGQGRHQGRLGALLVELDSGIRFKIGTGFSDAQRQNPPAIGSLITFKYYGTYDSGIPRFPSFLRLRGDEEM